jgi:hypothetical protein
VNRVLNQAVKQFVAGFRMPPVEAKRKFIQVVIPMLRGDRALVRIRLPVIYQYKNRPVLEQELIEPAQGFPK